MSVIGQSVTGSGSTGVCCPSARQWLAGHLYLRHCCLETRRVQICLLSASVTRCDRFLQTNLRNIEEEKKLHFCNVHHLNCNVLIYLTGCAD